MSDHESIRELLALGAAGLLDPAEERLVREHTAQCPACAAELNEFSALAGELAALPPPLPPADLVYRTAILLAAEADRRQGARFACAASVFALAFVLLIAAVLRTLAGDSAVLVWFGWASVTSVFGAASAFLLASRRRLERSIV